MLKKALNCWYCPRHGATVETEAGSQGTQNPNSSTLGHDAHRCPSPLQDPHRRPNNPGHCSPNCAAHATVLPKGTVETADLEERLPNEGPGPPLGPASLRHRAPTGALQQARGPRPGPEPGQTQAEQPPGTASTVKHPNGPSTGTSRDFPASQAFPSGAPTP